eukprot:TRINITY_DN2216_c0_g1_i15.p1 TRINITY_DN2216_c0_g1~~TRINITY_DN2216_c0_g1_i15.p1  ORF type:complete len:420 (-),score=-65.83 TRINITY_DN2216_c0_g1_i15:386-1585(-)
MTYQDLTQSMYYSSATQARFLLLLYFQSHCIDCLCSFTFSLISLYKKLTIIPNNKAMRSRKKKYRSLAQLVYDFSAMQIRLPLLLHLQSYFPLQKSIKIHNKRHTEIQCSQCLILLQCKSYFLYSFTFNIIFLYEKQQYIKQKVYQVLAQSAHYSFAMQVQFLLLLPCQYYYTLLSVLITKKRTEVQRFAPSPPISLPPMKSSNSFKQMTYQDLTQSMYYSSATQARFLLLLYFQSHCMLCEVGKKSTEAQRSQCMIFLQCKSDCLCSFTFSLISLYKKLTIIPNNKHTEIQCSQCLILLQCESYFLCSFIFNLIALYKEYQQYQTKDIPRYSVVSVLFFCNASQISFAPSSPILLNPIKSNNNAKQKTYQGLVWSVYYSSVMQARFSLLLHIQYQCPL